MEIVQKVHNEYTLELKPKNSHDILICIMHCSITNVTVQKAD